MLERPKEHLRQCCFKRKFNPTRSSAPKGEAGSYMGVATRDLRVLAVCIGRPEGRPGKKAKTGINKNPTSETVLVGKEGLADEAVCNRKYHGGPEQAVYVEGKNILALAAGLSGSRRLALAALPLPQSMTLFPSFSSGVRASFLGELKFVLTFGVAKVTIERTMAVS